MAYNMKNSALKMSAKTGSPLQKNYAGSPAKQTLDPIPTQQDSINARDMASGRLNKPGGYIYTDFKKEDMSRSREDYKNAQELINATKTNIKKTQGGKADVQKGDVKKVLQRGDYKTVASTKDIEKLDLPETKGGSLSTRVIKSREKKRREDLTKKAVKGTKKNTTGVIRGDKD